LRREPRSGPRPGGTGGRSVGRAPRGGATGPVRRGPPSPRGRGRSGPRT
jgi:hypothetical protein